MRYRPGILAFWSSRTTPAILANERSSIDVHRLGDVLPAPAGLNGLGDRQLGGRQPVPHGRGLLLSVVEDRHHLLPLVLVQAQHVANLVDARQRRHAHRAFGVVAMAAATAARLRGGQRRGQHSNRQEFE